MLVDNCQKRFHELFDIPINDAINILKDAPHQIVIVIDRLADNRTMREWQKNNHTGAKNTVITCGEEILLDHKPLSDKEPEIVFLPYHLLVTTTTRSSPSSTRSAAMLSSSRRLHDELGKSPRHAQNILKDIQVTQ